MPLGHPLPCALWGPSHWALPVVALTDAGSDPLQGLLGRRHAAVGCPGNASWGSLWGCRQHMGREGKLRELQVAFQIYRSMGWT